MKSNSTQTHSISDHTHINEASKSNERIEVHSIHFLSDEYPSESIRNHMQIAQIAGRQITIDYSKPMSRNDYVLEDIVQRGHLKEKLKAFVRAGPYSVLHFNPKSIHVAIVTCGGLCPGLNNVIRELVNTLFFNYETARVTGVRCVMT